MTIKNECVSESYDICSMENDFFLLIYSELPIFNMEGQFLSLSNVLFKCWIFCSDGHLASYFFKLSLKYPSWDTRKVFLIYNSHYVKHSTCFINEEFQLGSKLL